MFQKSLLRLRQLAAHLGVEVSTLVAVSVLAGSTFFFGKLAEEVMEGDTHAFDMWVLLALRNPADLADPVGPWWLETIMKDLTSMGGSTVMVLVTLLAVGFLLVERQRLLAGLVVFSVGGAITVSQFFKYIFGRPRPELVAHLVDVHTLSFPSGHATLAAATYLTLGVLLARTQSQVRTRVYLLSVAVILTVLIGVSRVYLGVHYPTDVLAGWCLGAGWALLCWLLAQWLNGRNRSNS